MSATSRNPGNWHWTNKDCRSWTKFYFSKELMISAEKNGISLSIVKLVDCTGDVDVSMRKGKIITIYDVKVSLEFSGKIGETLDVSGTITIPEVAYDTDEYVFEIDIFSETKENQVIRSFIKTEIVPELKRRLGLFSATLIDVHGKDVLLAVDNDMAQKLPLSTVHGTLENGTDIQKSVNHSDVTKKDVSVPSIINTITISDTVDFQAPVSELYTTFIDHSRIEAWTRSSAMVDSKVGGKFSLFGGNVMGEFMELVEFKKIVQKWRLSTWKSGHYAILKLLFDQSMDGTLLRMEMSEVPIDQEDVVRSNFTEYYIKPIKTTFGFGSVL